MSSFRSSPPSLFSCSLPIAFLSLLSLLAPLSLSPLPARAGDWPQWRHDATRTAAAPEPLPAVLQREWEHRLPAARPAWPAYPRLAFDATAGEPVVAGDALFINSALRDSVTCLDARTGELRWRFHAGAPVRFAPLVWRDRVYAVSDDGYLWCLGATDGEVRWRRGGRPEGRADRLVLGNGRMGSLWPARGGPVLQGETVYFAAGVWPFEGVSVLAVDAATGEVRWRNAAVGKIPGALLDHSTHRDAGLSPQGYLSIVAGRLIVPSGRALPARLDLATGALDPYSTGWGGREGLAKGSWYVAARGGYAFLGGDLYDTHTWRRLQADPSNAKELGRFREPLFLDGAICFSRPVNELRGYRPVGTGYRGAVAWDVTRPATVKATKDWQGKPAKTVELARAWEIPGRFQLHIAAGSRLYAGARGEVLALEPPAAGAPPREVWRAAVEGTPARMIAGAGRLFVVTDTGLLVAFGAEERGASVAAGSGSGSEGGSGSGSGSGLSPSLERRARTILAEVGEGIGVEEGAGAGGTGGSAGVSSSGWALLGGAGALELARAVVSLSRLEAVVVIPERARARAAREALDREGLLGTRISVIEADWRKGALPPYFARLVAIDARDAASVAASREDLAGIYRLLRPYGGTACLRAPAAELRARVSALALAGAQVTRRGELAVLRRRGALPGTADWTHPDADAGNSLASLDRRVRAPLGILWFGGDADRLYPAWDFTHARGPAPLVARGRLFFQVFPSLHALDIYTGRLLWSVLLPGAEGSSKPRPFLAAAAAESVYLADPAAGGGECVRLDAATGRPLGRLRSPVEGKGWRDIRLVGDLLVGVSGESLVALDRAGGELRWRREAEGHLASVAAGSGLVFSAEATLPDRRGQTTVSAGTVRALDLRDGAPLWKRAWEPRAGEKPPARLIYSAAIDVLLAVGTRVSAYRGRGGAVLWRDRSIEGCEEAILHPERLIPQTGLLLDPLTAAPLGGKLWNGKPNTNWDAGGARGCNRAIGGFHLALVRDAYASYYDLSTRRQTFLRGIRSGCTNSLIPAGGLLSAPNFAHGCSCNYPVFTSLALVPLEKSAP